MQSIITINQPIPLFPILLFFSKSKLIQYLPPKEPKKRERERGGKRLELSPFLNPACISELRAMPEKQVENRP